MTLRQFLQRLTPFSSESVLACLSILGSPPLSQTTVLVINNSLDSFRQVPRLAGTADPPSLLLGFRSRSLLSPFSHTIPHSFYTPFSLLLRRYVQSRRIFLRRLAREPLPFTPSVFSFFSRSDLVTLLSPTDALVFHKLRYSHALSALVCYLSFPGFLETIFFSSGAPIVSGSHLPHSK